MGVVALDQLERTIPVLGYQDSSFDCHRILTPVGHPSHGLAVIPLGSQKSVCTTATGGGRRRTTASCTATLGAGRTASGFRCTTALCRRRSCGAARGRCSRSTLAPCFRRRFLCGLVMAMMRGAHTAAWGNEVPGVLLESSLESAVCAHIIVKCRVLILKALAVDEFRIAAECVHDFRMGRTELVKSLQVSHWEIARGRTGGGNLYLP